MQALAALRISPPCGEGGEEIEPGAEAGFQHRENGLPLPGRRQVVAVQENLPGLVRSAVGRVVNIVKNRTEWRAVRAELQRGWLDGHGESNVD